MVKCQRKQEVIGHWKQDAVPPELAGVVGGLASWMRGPPCHCHAPGRAQDFVLRGPALCPKVRLPFVGCRGRQRALQRFSRGESREKGPGTGCAMLEGMRKGYTSRRRHPLGDRQ